MKQVDLGCCGVPRGLVKALRVLTSPTSERHGLPSIFPESAAWRRVPPNPFSPLLCPPCVIAPSLRLSENPLSLEIPPQSGRN